MAGKQFQFYLDIICNLDKFYMVLIKFVYLLPLNCMRDRILSLVSVQGTNGGTKSGKIDAMLYYSCVFNMLIINVVEVGLFLLSFPHYLLCNMLITN